MKKKRKVVLISSIIFFYLLALYSIEPQAQNKKKIDQASFDTININYQQGEVEIDLAFMKGLSHNHPTFAVWLEDKEGNYIETIFVTKYISSGVFGYADAGNLSWKNEKGEALRPAALPYWSHKRNIISRDSLYVPTPENPVPDAISGATPKGNFILRTSSVTELPETFTILLEINQTWDWNEYWTNNKYPDDLNYKTSSQPSIIYAADVDMANEMEIIQLKPVGHGHFSGKDGLLYKDLSTLTTALDIAKEITVCIRK